MWQQLLQHIGEGNTRALARSISLVENEQPGYETLLAQLPHSEKTKIIGITGPPGAGKSTLVDGLIGELLANNNKVAVLCVDPSSPFHLGAVLGDRIRMSQWYSNPNVFIRSLATRGSMGGLNPKIIEITDLLKAAGFDYIIIETVGVGQSEIEIAGLADVTVVVVVPEAGDEVQTMKAGLMEIADIFVVNKSDRPEADVFVKNLRQMLAPAFSNHQKEIPVIKTIASQQTGISELAKELDANYHHTKENQVWLFTEKLFQLVQKDKMKNIDKSAMKLEVERSLGQNHFNLYKLAELYKFQ